ncbi:MAG: HPr family phosphocarrier protein [Candidatus Krumholzibacteriia bacterium]
MRNELGLHLRSASNFVRLASKYQSQIRVGTPEIAPVDGKSILGLATLGAAKGTPLIITAEGPDEGEAIRELIRLVEESFREEG